MQSRFIILSFLLLLFYSCHKEYSCESCLQGSGPRVPPGGPQSPSITALNCASGNFSSTAIESTPYSGQYILSYSGANGLSYKADTVMSTGVTGLTAILVSGTLANGNGSLTYTISGTPANVGDAGFIISFAGKNCSATLRIDPNVVVWNGAKVPIAAEKERSLVISGSGVVKAWGNNQFGQLGSPITDIVTIGTGKRHSFAVKSDGTLWGWGWNGNGQLGVDYTFSFSESRPVNVTTLSGASGIAGGSFHSLVQKNDGSVYTMGSNVYGQLGDGSNILNRYVPMIVLGL